MEPLPVSYNPILIALSYLVSALGSFTALRLMEHLRSSATTSEDHDFWLASAALAMGAGGIWSMHFVAMAALKAPMSISYEFALTTVSLIVALAATGTGFWVVARAPDSGLKPVVLAGTIMGVGIAGMHYSGMAAMRMSAEIRYDPLLVLLSICIAILASIGALATAFIYADRFPTWLAALGLAAAVSAMHHTGMVAASFVPAPPVEISFTVEPITLAYVVLLVSVVVLSIELALTFGLRDRTQFSGHEGE